MTTSPPRSLEFAVALVAAFFCAAANAGAQESIAPVVRLLAPVASGDDGKAVLLPANVLSVEDVVRGVVARNQTLAQMSAAWQAASTRYRQVTSPDDPMLSSMVAPNSFSSRSVEPGYRIEISQKILWPGKKALRGDMAQAEAGAAGDDAEDMRLQLVEMARNAYYDYFLVARSAAVNEETLKLLGEFRANAETRFRTGQIPQQDILQADVEIGKQRERSIILERMRRVAVARLNTLMHQEPTEPLLAPPEKLPRGEPVPAAPELLALALARRPDLRALEMRIAGDRAALALAVKDYWPDLEVAAAYDTIMGNGPMRDLAPQIGLRMNLPVRTGKRHAAVAEAQAKISQRCAELAAKIDQVKFQVQEAYEQIVESERIIQLYETKILPQSEENVKAAQNAYVTGKTPFVSLIEAQRSLVAQRDRSFEAAADASRRRATLDRLIGQSP
jgi:cobalt-zinc-cadmium efflux system outer membrane protein